MRRERFGRGRRSGGGGGRGGRSSHGPRNSRSRSYDRSSAESGNKRERIAVESGHLVFIDQFMLANPQFIEKLHQLPDDDPENKNELIHEYGGEVVQLEPGTYRIERDPFAFSIVVHPEGVNPNMRDLTRDSAEQIGHVYIDTRCLAMIDRELLDDQDLLDKYQQLWFSGQDKSCRDLLRDNGGAVRYGFQRNGDDLVIYGMPDSDVLCLWPPAAPQIGDSSSRP